MKWKYGLTALVLVLGLGLLVSSGSAEEAEFDEATVHLSPTCGCCIQHVQYLERAGVDVEVIEHSNQELQELWDEKEVGNNYRACHLTEVSGQETDVKGHVPLDVFNQVVEENPDADIVTLPGMPQGSPGMPGAQNQKWIFYSIQDGEVTGEYTTR